MRDSPLPASVNPAAASSLSVTSNTAATRNVRRSAFDTDRTGVRDYVDALTGVRGLAAAMVMLYHAWQVSGAPALVAPGLGIDLTPPVAMGWLGVDVFFVLSGFVLTRPAVSRDPAAPRLGMTYAEFVRRRALRVLPAYYLNLLALVVLAGVGPMSAPPAVSDVLTKLLLVHNLVPAYGATINGVYWTLPVEWDFYLVMPLLLPLLPGVRLGWTIGAALAVSLAVKVIGYESGTWPVLIHQLPARIDQFVLGMAAAAATGGNLRPTLARAAFVAGSIGLIASTYMFAARFDQYLQYHWITLAGRPLASVAIALLIIGCATRVPAAERIFGNRPAVGLGMISYSLYLWHLPVALLLGGFGVGQSLTGVARFLLLAASIGAVSVAISAASWRWIERPFLVARRHLTPSDRWQRSIALHPLAVLAALASVILAIASVRVP